MAKKNVVIESVPTSGPVFVRPADAEGEVGLAALEDFFKRAV